MTVRQYIASKTKSFNTYVANRVSIIQELSKAAQWRHIQQMQHHVVCQLMFFSSLNRGSKAHASSPNLNHNGKEQQK